MLISNLISNYINNAYWALNNVNNVWKRNKTKPSEKKEEGKPTNIKYDAILDKKKNQKEKNIKTQKRNLKSKLNKE